MIYKFSSGTKNSKQLKALKQKTSNFKIKFLIDVHTQNKHTQFKWKYLNLESSMNVAKTI